MIDRYSKGFTLIETLLSIMILSMIVVTTISFSQYVLTNRKIQDHKIDVQDSLRIGINRMARELRQSQGILDNSNENTIYFLNNNFVVVNYSFEDDHLYRKEGNAVKQPFVSNIQDLKFDYKPFGVQYQEISQVTISIKGKNVHSEDKGIITTVQVRVR